MNFAQSRPWRDPVIFAGLLAILCVPLFTWWNTVGPFSDYFRYVVPNGQRIYLLSKLVGLYTVIGFWLQAIYGLLGTTCRKKLRVEWGIGFHRLLGLSVLVLAAGHASLFIAAVALRTHEFPAQYLQLSFEHGFYRSMIALGLTALIVTAVAVIAALMRSKFARYFRYAHWFALPAFLLAVFHSWRIGSETRMSPLSMLYLVMVAVTVGLIIARLCQSRLR